MIKINKILGFSTKKILFFNQPKYEHYKKNASKGFPLYLAKPWDAMIIGYYENCVPDAALIK